MTREPRYDCPICRDTGYADCWEPAVMHFLYETFYLPDGSIPERWASDERTIAASAEAIYKPPYASAPKRLGNEVICYACRCERGQRVAAKRNGEGQPMYRQMRLDRDAPHFHGNLNELCSWFAEAGKPNIWEPPPGEYAERFGGF